MNFKDLASKILMDNVEPLNNSDKAQSALDKLVGGSSGFDLGDLVSKFSGAGGDIARMAQSWLGDGPNEDISATQVQEVIGSNKIQAFAAKLGIDKGEAADNLAKILPELIDRSSQGGSLLGTSGRSGGLAGLAAKFFRR